MITAWSDVVLIDQFFVVLLSDRRGRVTETTWREARIMYEFGAITHGTNGPFLCAAETWPHAAFLDVVLRLRIAHLALSASPAGLIGD